jgi:hypothetical protein
VIFFAPIVEGDGERLAVERLLWRIAQAANPAAQLQVNPAIRVKSGSFLNDSNYRDRYVALAAAKARQVQGHVLILLDCEDECPAALASRLVAEVRAQAIDVGLLVVLAHREYETWFMAAAESLRGVEGLSSMAIAPADPERTRDAKGWLGRLMPNGYDPVTHQLAFTRTFDIQAARLVPSFDRLYRKIEELVVESA